MKRVTLLLIILLHFTNYAQDKNIAKVYVINGLEVYIMNEPLRSYDVIYGKGGGLNFGSYLTGGLINNSIATRVNKFVKGVKKKAKKEGKEIDAIIYSGGKNVVAIKFNEDATDENKQLARVRRVNGIPTFAMSEPVNDFIVVKTKGGGLKWKSAMTGGIINNSVEEDLSKFAKKFKKMYRKGEIDAIMYTGGKSCDGIKFK